MTTKWTSIAWRKRNDWIDFYETPTWCIEKLLQYEKFDWLILEPCSWAWAISKVLEKEWYSVISQDIREDDWVYWNKWINFLNFWRKSYIKNIITNPPFCLAQQIIEKSLEIADWKIAMFLKLQFLESAERYDFFKNTPLKTIRVFCKRPTLYPSNWPIPKNKWTIAYAWYVWEKWYKWEPIIDWII